MNPIPKIIIETLAIAGAAIKDATAQGKDICPKCGKPGFPVGFSNKGEHTLVVHWRCFGCEGVNVESEEKAFSA